MLAQYLPDNYWLNYHFVNAVNSGTTVGDAVEAVEEVRQLMMSGKKETDAEVTEAWINGWVRIGERLKCRAEHDLNRGRDRSAGEKLRRASVHYMTAEIIAKDHDPRKEQFFDEMRRLTFASIDLARPGDEICTIKFNGVELPGVFTCARGVEGPAPAMVFCNGMHTHLEWALTDGLSDKLADRGIGLLVFDHPGSGVARFKHQLYHRHDIEDAIGAAFDYLETRNDVDNDRMGVCGGSFGGYYATRTAAMENRAKACVIWGAFWTARVAELDLLRRWQQDKESLIPYEQNVIHEVMARMGVETIEELVEATDGFTLATVIDKVDCPMLVVHGSDDLQVPVTDAERTVNGAINSPRAELKIYTPEDGGEIHCNLDNLADPLEEMADFAAEVL